MVPMVPPFLIPNVPLPVLAVPAPVLAAPTWTAAPAALTRLYVAGLASRGREGYASALAGLRRWLHAATRRLRLRAVGRLELTVVQVLHHTVSKVVGVGGGGGLCAGRRQSLALPIHLVHRPASQPRAVAQLHPRAREGERGREGQESSVAPLHPAARSTIPATRLY
eukprot:scaffold308749_cov32-Tisochrysis_lutea.AAC.2